MQKEKVRVRIAPSPTGYLHVGTAMIALLNYIFARSKNGNFLVRIEDTDIKRSREDMVKSILEGFKWLNLNWDEEVLYQSDHFDEYRKHAENLLQNGKAYWCYCTPEEIKERKEKAINTGRKWIYDRRCYDLTEEEKKKFESEERPKALRFYVPPGKTTYNDLIHGEITRENAEIEDFVIIKSDGSPAYNHSVVVDDHNMEISHVLRGDDHISNTFKQILLYRANEWELPEFGHIPLILGTDGSKLSKRHGAVSISHYREQGIFPEALINHLSLLGWSPKTEEEIFSMEELINRFSLENVSRNPAIFDIERLEWLNGEWMQRMDGRKVAERLKRYLENNDCGSYEIDYLIDVIKAMGNRAKKLKDFIDIGYYFFTDEFEYDDEGADRYFYGGLEERLKGLVERLNKLKSFNKEELEKVLRNYSSEIGCRAAELIHPIRLGISGMTFGPGLFTLMEVLGKDEVIERLNNLIDYLKGGNS